MRVERRDKFEMLCAIIKIMLSHINCYSGIWPALFSHSIYAYLQRSISWQLHFLGRGFKWNSLIGKVWHVDSKGWWKMSRSWHGR